MEVIVVGMCAGFEDLGGGEQRSQSSKSISWQDLVRRDGAVVDSLRQFPLHVVRILTAELNGRESYLTYECVKCHHPIGSV